MQSATLPSYHAAATQRRTTTTGKRVWVGRSASALAIAFLLFDASIKLAPIPAVTQAFAQLGFPIGLAPLIGTLAIACTLVYAVPRTAVLGAILLTGYLGGALAAQLRIQPGAFPLVFPFIIATLVWGGLLLRDSRVRALL